MHSYVDKTVVDFKAENSQPGDPQQYGAGWGEWRKKQRSQVAEMTEISSAQIEVDVCLCV